MLLTKNTKRISLAVLSTILLSACGGSNVQSYNTSNGEIIELGIDNPICQEGTAQHEGQVLDNSNKGIENVTITVDGCSVQTDKNGHYKLENIVTRNRTSVTYEKEGYTKNSSIINIKNTTSNYLEAKLKTSGTSWTFNSKEGAKGGVVTISDMTNYILDGNRYDGDIKAYYTLKNTNTNEGRDSMPGTYQGLDINNNIVSFVSHAYFDLDLKDTEGNKLNAMGDIQITVDNINNIKDETIPLWNYNYDRGIWVENGVAYRDENGNYICDIPHSGTWSLSKTIETEMGLYKGYIVDENDNPITNVRIKAMAENWVGQDITTDENGEFSVYVVPNKTFTVSAYDYKEKYGADFPGTIAAIASGEIVEE